MAGNFAHETSLVIAYSSVFGRKQQHRSHALATVFTGVGHLRLFLFPILKRPVKEQSFSAIKETKAASLEELKTISKARISEALQGLEKALTQICYF